MAHLSTTQYSSRPELLFSQSKMAPLFVIRSNRPFCCRTKIASLQVSIKLSSPSHVRASLSDSSQESSEGDIADEWGEKPAIADEWGEKGDTGPELGYPKQSDSDPPTMEDEWGGTGMNVGNGAAGQEATAGKEDKIKDLKNFLVDTFYGTDCGFRASPEVRGEVSELVYQLEAMNPNPAPAEATSLLDGTWILLYTAFSELLPILAMSSIPLLKVEKITQSIDCNKLSLVNTATLSTPPAKVSFNASASFTVRSSSRIQVEFNEGSFLPPEINSALSLPENVNVFGQNISLSPLQQTLNPLQEAAASIARAISGQPPLKIPISGNRAKPWLLITYLDEDLRICRGDGGGLFILAKEGSPLLD